jgi:hypothetical protein
MADPSAARPTFELRVPLPASGAARHRSLTLWIARPFSAPQRPLVARTMTNFSLRERRLRKIAGSGSVQAASPVPLVLDEPRPWDAPVVLVDASLDEIYGLDVEWP